MNLYHQYLVDQVLQSALFIKHPNKQCRGLVSCSKGDSIDVRVLPKQKGKSHLFASACRYFPPGSGYAESRTSWCFTAHKCEVIAQAHGISQVSDEQPVYHPLDGRRNINSKDKRKWVTDVTSFTGKASALIHTFFWFKQKCDGKSEFLE